MSNTPADMLSTYKPAYDALMKVYPLTAEDLPEEIWRPIPDWEDYHISNFGRVKHKARILKPALIRAGYLQVGLHKDGKQKRFLLHRLVALAFIPNPDSKPEINHRDGFKFNCHVSNLEWATRSENIRHAVKFGLIKSGEEHGRAKLTTRQVQFIRDNPDRLTIYKLAEMFGVRASQISQIRTGKRWKQAGGGVHGRRTIWNIVHENRR